MTPAALKLLIADTRKTAHLYSDLFALRGTTPEGFKCHDKACALLKSADSLKARVQPLEEAVIALTKPNLLPAARIYLLERQASLLEFIVEQIIANNLLERK